MTSQTINITEPMIFFVRSRWPKPLKAFKCNPNEKGCSNYSLGNGLEAIERSKIEGGAFPKPAFRVIGMVKIRFGLQFNPATSFFLSFVEILEVL